MGSSVLQEAPPNDYSFPPLHYIFEPNNSLGDSQSRSEGSPFSPVLIAIIGCLGAAFLIVSYYTMVARFCRTRRFFRRGRRDDDYDEAEDRTAVFWPIFTQGLQESVVQAIPICKYSKSEGLVDGSECAVCLSEFEEEESLRLLPKCNHAFHLSCIDKWLQSHSNCPLCRANVVSATPRLVPSTPAPELAVLTAVQDNAAQVTLRLQETRSSADVQNSSDQRSSETTADADVPSNARRHSLFTRKRDLSTFGEEAEVQTEEIRRFKALSRRNKVYSKLTESLQLEDRIVGERLRCFSTGRALLGLEDTYQDCDQVVLPIRRSSSLGTCSKFGVRLDPFRGNQSSSVDVCLETDAEAPHLLSSSSSVKLTVDLNNGTGSSSRYEYPGNFKSKSLNLDADLKNKSQMNDPVVGRMFSLKGPISVKRSFSGGRLFGFRVKNMVGIANARVPV